MIAASLRSIIDFPHARQRLADACKRVYQSDGFATITANMAIMDSTERFRDDIPRRAPAITALCVKARPRIMVNLPLTRLRAVTGLERPLR
jgi:hypothetical protein